MSKELKHLFLVVLREWYVYGVNGAHTHTNTFVQRPEEDFGCSDLLLSLNTEPGSPSHLSSTTEVESVHAATPSFLCGFCGFELGSQA